ncbi:hypothetical protein A2774_00850 [Candidatus Roizmanbacteria bacterium RIFCSPHIGHO2_01_FULL_39_12c]|uniref:Glycosyltransferase RgtA/B/C/D-like domain-containing protein n=1 Tax=Candidatus Roizmanbacteria bacterium RIFCSPHIGHO2_01_FULL_39_12c TaxID=1802031 RepID=A0A1F7GG87_9BACT|nr:MAG: hypothetical protein A2774_00850 [Candidatus Roizmanbacteria bacterium RIFCSPHIGHO2_01_FULL_39_12c]OGK46540.1 MAG: hypothetical protein A2963_02265 [Candidatus Roizmanbacteria bacterium RIFCSPLOWO2_01_FULL_40_13]
MIVIPKIGSKINWELFFIILLFAVSFLYRIYGLSTHNPPFWVDEFSSANQGKILLKHGFSAFVNPEFVIEHYNVTTHLLIAATYRLFGVNELAARLPIVLIGSFVPIAVYLLAKFLFNQAVAISASLLTLFSYFEIVWSRQARGYIIVQFLLLLTLLFYLRIIGQKKSRPFLILLFSFSILSGILTHPFFYLVLLTLVLHFLITNLKRIPKLIKNPFFYLTALGLAVSASQIGLVKGLISQFKAGTFVSNNLWYYHSFLWREYGILTLLGILGYLIYFFRNRKTAILLLLYLAIHLLFVSFGFKPYVSRYLLPVFPLFLIGMSFSLWQLLSTLPSRHSRFRVIWLTLLTLFIVLSGHKFTGKPKKYYSLNHDFREIANIDYNLVYDIIKAKLPEDREKSVVIETWWDRARWYLDENFKNIKILRWNDAGYINGLPTRTECSVNSIGEKILKGTTVKLVLEKKDLEFYLKNYPVGFIFIDDSSLPNDVIEFAEKNFKKEQYLDHYPLDDNPYSIWPATLYSWGVE